MMTIALSWPLAGHNRTNHCLYSMHMHVQVSMPVPPFVPRLLLPSMNNGGCLRIDLTVVRLEESKLKNIVFVRIVG